MRPCFMRPHVQEAVSARKSELAKWLKEGLIRLGPVSVVQNQEGH